MPGDAIVPEAMYITTQAATIAAPPERVWPWLAQMEASRGCWYSYDRVDNECLCDRDKRVHAVVSMRWRRREEPADGGRRGHLNYHSPAGAPGVKDSSSLLQGPLTAVA